MCSNTLHNYPRVLEFVPECYQTQKMYDKAVDTYSSTIIFFPERLNECLNEYLHDFS